MSSSRIIEFNFFFSCYEDDVDNLPEMHLDDTLDSAGGGVNGVDGGTPGGGAGGGDVVFHEPMMAT